MITNCNECNFKSELDDRLEGTITIGGKTYNVYLAKLTSETVREGKTDLAGHSEMKCYQKRTFTLIEY